MSKNIIEAFMYTILIIESISYFGQLLDGLFRAFVPTVDHIYSVRQGVVDVLLHEAPEPAQVCADAGNSHHGALR